MPANLATVTNPGHQPLKPKQIKALGCLVCGLSQRKTAELCRVSEATVSRWTREPVFVAEFERLQTIQRDRIQGLMGTVAQHAAKPLLEALSAEDPDGGPLWAVRLRAARTGLAAFEALSRKAAESTPPPAGPLIVLPPGTARMAVAVEMPPAGHAAKPQNAQNAQEAAGEAQRLPADRQPSEGPALPSEPIDVRATVVQEGREGREGRSDTQQATSRAQQATPQPSRPKSAGPPAWWDRPDRR